MLSGVHFVRNYIFVGKVNFEGSWNDYRNLGCGGRGAGCRRSEDWGGSESKAEGKSEMGGGWGGGGAQEAQGVRKEKG